MRYSSLPEGVRNTIGAVGVLASLSAGAALPETIERHIHRNHVERCLTYEGPGQEQNDLMFKSDAGEIRVIRLDGPRENIPILSGLESGHSYNTDALTNPLGQIWVMECY